MEDDVVTGIVLMRKGENPSEVLAEIKTDATLRRIPVVVLTSSQSDDDILSVYNLQANCYVPKPADLERFLTVIRSIEHFWFTTARLPGA